MGRQDLFLLKGVLGGVNVGRTGSNWIGHVGPSTHPSTTDRIHLYTHTRTLPHSRTQDTHQSAMTLKRRWKGSKCAWLAVSTRHHFWGVHAYVCIDVIDEVYWLAVATHRWRSRVHTGG